MNLDFIMIFISTLFIYNGFKKGFLKQLSTIISILFIYFITNYIYKIINNSTFNIINKYILKNQILSYNIFYVLKLIIILFIIFFFIKLSISIVENFLSFIGVNLINSLGGALFGLLQSIFILSLVTVILVDIKILFNPITKKGTHYFKFLYEIGCFIKIFLEKNI